MTMKLCAIVKHVLSFCLAMVIVVSAGGQNSQGYLNDAGSPAYSIDIPVENGYIDVSNEMFILISVCLASTAAH